MTRTHNTGFKMLFGAVVTAGMAVLSIGGYRLIDHQPPFAWLVLSLLTAAAGSLSLKIPGVNGRASIGDALIASSVFLFGPLAGAVTAAFEGVAGSLRCRTSSRRLQFMLFNTATMALSAYVAGNVFFAAHGRPLFSEEQPAPVPLLPGPLVAFAAAYFLVNTWIVAAASALDRSAGFFQTWRDGFLWTCVNYLAATFVSGILMQSGDPVTLSVLGTLAAGCAAVYVSARAHVRPLNNASRGEQAEPAAAAPAGRAA